MWLQQKHGVFQVGIPRRWQNVADCTHHRSIDTGNPQISLAKIGSRWNNEETVQDRAKCERGLVEIAHAWV